MSAAILKDVTQNRLSSANKVRVGKPQQQQDSIAVLPTATVKPTVAPVPKRTVRRNDPYNWEWRVPAEEMAQQEAQPSAMPSLALQPQLFFTPLQQPQQQEVQSPLMQQQPMSPFHDVSVAGSPQHAMQQVSLPHVETEQTPVENDGKELCRALVQFKCHHGEFTSAFELRKGQYVVVQGDRGHDVGVVIRINLEEAQQYVERTGPMGQVIRYASQREVDYWASDLKTDETAALEYCRQRVAKHRLQMEVRHAEYQFDKKKLTFYYEAKSRVDFVTLLKELFREFSCRIWMEKIRSHE